MFEDMNEKEIRNYLEFLFWHYRVVDSFWYIFIEEEQGTKTANHFNERVWGRVSGLAAREIKKRYGITSVGLDAFYEAQRYFPWSIMVGYKFEKHSDELIISAPECPTQRARLRRGLGEYDCKEMHRLEFIDFARAIDPDIQVECLYAPPDEHPENEFCRWRFTMKGSK